MTARHIALVVHDFSTGGSERIAIRLANRWVASGRRVTILCGTEQGALRTLVDPHIPVEACIPETVRSPWSRIQLGWRLAKMVRRHQPDVVFAPGNFHLLVLTVLARMRFDKRPKFLCKLSNPVTRSTRSRLREALKKATLRAVTRPVDVLVAMSSSLHDQARDILPNARIVTIHEPILEDHDDPATTPREPRDGPRILCVGRLCDQKDFLTALRAFAALDPGVHARLVILGEGPDRSMLIRETERLGIAARVEMPGYVASILPRLQQADLLLMTSRYEGYPAVLIEALAAGLPVVTTDCSPAIGEIMAHSDYGRVVTSRQPSAIAEAITIQLHQPRPDARSTAPLLDRHRIGASAAAYLELFDRVTAWRGTPAEP